MSVKLAIAATFTAEPIEPVLRFWLDETRLPHEVVFAPYHQVFQQLLDPTSVLRTNEKGANVVLVRFEDWLSDGSTRASDPHEALVANARKFSAALRNAIAVSSASWVLACCPTSDRGADDARLRAALDEVEALVRRELASIRALDVIGVDELLSLYPVKTPNDAERERIGHVPYTDELFAALGTHVARTVYRAKVPARKVLVLDCDQTLWKGVCAEDGAAGVELDPARRALQARAVELHAQGMLICIVSKNVEEDVAAVFDSRRDMVLKREHVVAWRVNWRVKSANLVSLAQELNLGLDAFIFIDDNPAECAEVRAACPTVMTLQLPAEDRIESFLRHVWAFDVRASTSEDAQRTALYRENLARERFRESAGDFDAFIEGLQLEVSLAELEPADLDRAAQLTQRTNQFNTTTRRRTAAELAAFVGDGGHTCLCVRVRDRFGDYGLVGVVIYEVRDARLDVESWMLSCRVLGRGVEHAILRDLAARAARRGATSILIAFTESAKNRPARDFLDGIGARNAQGYACEVAFAAAVRYQAPALSPEVVADKPAAPVSVDVVDWDRLSGLHTPRVVARAVAAALRRRKGERKVSTPFLGPRDITESLLVEIFEEVLAVSPVGVRDTFAELGGTSLQAVSLIARVNQKWRTQLPLFTLNQAQTAEAIAACLHGDRNVVWSPLVEIASGGERPPLFLIHGLLGNVLNGTNLARSLGPDQPLYAFQARGIDGRQPPLSTIEEMAALYLAELKRVQPRGPYALVGWCFGGLVALEMAQRLAAENEHVGLLVLIETEAPRASEAAIAHDAAAMALVKARAKQDRSELISSGIQDFFRRFGGDLRLSYDRLAHLPVEQQVEVALAEAKRIGLFPPHFDLAAVMASVFVQNAHLSAIERYRPARYRGKVTLLRIGATARDDVSAWSTIADEVESVSIPGLAGKDAHLGLMELPMVGFVGDALGRLIAASRASGDAP